MVVGIRPEHLMLGELPDAALVGQGLVSMIEPLGAETLITLAIGEQQAICRAPAGVLAVIGDSLTVSVLASHLHGFSSDTGLRC
jgi:multiple sugar transport system ATP-binding protein